MVSNKSLDITFSDLIMCLSRVVSLALLAMAFTLGCSRQPDFSDVQNESVDSQNESADSTPQQQVQGGASEGEWVSDGQPCFVLVTSDDPSPVVEFAAEEMVAHVKAATGGEVPVVREGVIESGPYERQIYPYRIYLGDTQKARESGILSQKLGPDEFVLKTVETDLLVVGKEDKDFDPRLGGTAKDMQGFRKNPRLSGTLLGVYELLERYFRVRWLWPGELGTFTPKIERVEIPELDELVAPAFQYTSFTTRLKEPSLADVYTYLQRHRINPSARPVPLHTFAGWWDKLGAKHPDWFLMNARGERGGGRGTQVPINPANEGLRDYILNEAWDGGDLLDLSEVDSLEYSRCPESMAMDSPKADTFRPAFSFIDRVVSDRYAKFWRDMYVRAAEKNPNVKVTTFLYWQTFHAPLDEIELSPNIHGEFTPWMKQTQFIPMPEDALAHVKEQWLGWKKTGMTMAYRPNYLWGGYVMPFLSIRQVGELFKFTVENGSVGFHGDSLIGHWATQGPMLYLHMRLLTDPSLDVEEVYNEYLSAFGPAADAVRNYWDFWEQYSDELVNRLYKEGARQWPIWGINELIDAPKLYPPEAFEQGFALLEKAQEAAATSDNAEYKNRVEFLTNGLRHARLAANFLAQLDEGAVPVNDPEKFEKARAAWRELQAFRDEQGGQALFNLHHLENSSEARIKNIAMLKAAPGEMPSLPEISPEPETSSFAQWMFRPDPKHVGIQEDWAGQSALESGWKPVSVPSNWDETEWAGYRGVGWYQTRFYVPAEWAGESLRLDFENVSAEEIAVFINGKPIRQRKLSAAGQSAARLFTVDLPAASVKFGESNSLVVKLVANGTSPGLTGIIKGYRPHPEDWLPFPPLPQ